jgi:hypothetical protein
VDQTAAKQEFSSEAIGHDVKEVVSSAVGHHNSCKYSSGWHNSMKLYGLHLMVSGEKLLTDNVAVEEFIKQFEQMVCNEKLSPE